MPTITAIKPQKNQKRVNIFLDNKFGFGLDLENFVKLSLKVEQELDEKEIKKIKETSDKTKILNRALTFLTIRPRSEKEIKDWMRRKKIDGSFYEYIFEKVKDLNLIDDLSFAKWWVEQRQSFSPKTKKILTNELKIKGVKNEIITEVLSETEIDEVKMAKDLVNKKSYKWQRFDEKTRRQKISQYLFGKGFDWNVISNVVK
jgi:regulatory protein